MADFEPKQFGKYFLLDKLAVGGMAEIYKAKTFGVDGFEKLLVIKRILPHCAADSEFITMLIDEAKLSVLLSHANIVQVYDLGKVGDDYFIAMEFISGVNLRDILYISREQKELIPHDIAVYIASEICKGLDYAHRKTDDQHHPLGIVHRDVSPQNVLISYEGEVKIVDFGIAKAAMNISHTMAGILKGKIAYMSPEQALGRPIDRRTDIFSVGILLYEMITGEKLFTGESQFEVLKKIRTTKIQVKNLPETIPIKLRELLAKILAYNPEERYHHAGDLQVELTKFLYAQYLDFSPRKLSKFITEKFQARIQEEAHRAAKTTSQEQQTSSMSVKEGKKQVELVHGNTPLPEIGSITARGSKTQTEKKRSGFLKLIVAGMIPLLLAMGSYIAFNQFPTLRFWEEEKPAVQIETPPSATVSSRIMTIPAGARIYLDNKDTGLRTPATISNLVLNREYQVRLELEGYGIIERTLKPLNKTPLELSAELQKPLGILNIISEPLGASIMMNGKLTGNVTPATLENLPLETDVRITLSKPEYQDFEQVVRLSNAKPQKVSTRLSPLVAERGSIALTSTPSGAAVIMNGETTGRTTPATISNLDLKKPHHIELSLKGFDIWSTQVELTAAQTVPVDATLTRMAPTAEKPIIIPEAPVEKPKPQPEKKPQVVTKKIPPKEASPPSEPLSSGGSAKIRLASNPSDADIFINAEYKGKTPLTLTVPSGRVSVLVNKEGLSRFSKKIELKPGETVDLTDIELADLYGEVSIISSPARAEVMLDGQQVPKTPVIVRNVRTDQEHSVIVTLKGYKTWTHSFKMDGSKKSFNIILEKE